MRSQASAAAAGEQLHAAEQFRRGQSGVGEPLRHVPSIFHGHCGDSLASLLPPAQPCIVSGSDTFSSAQRFPKGQAIIDACFVMILVQYGLCGFLRHNYEGCQTHLLNVQADVLFKPMQWLTSSGGWVD